VRSLRGTSSHTHIAYTHTHTHTYMYIYKISVHFLKDQNSVRSGTQIPDKSDLCKTLGHETRKLDVQSPVNTCFLRKKCQVVYWRRHCSKYRPMLLLAINWLTVHKYRRYLFQSANATLPPTKRYVWTTHSMWWHTRRNAHFVFRRNGRVHLNRPEGVSSVDYWQPRCSHQR